MAVFDLFSDFLIGTQMLLWWAPNQAGLAVGIGQVFECLGTVLSMQAFHCLTATFGVSRALIITGPLLSLLSLIPAMLSRIPNARDVHPRSMHAERGYEDSCFQCCGKGVKLHWSVIIGLRDFWLYVFIVFSGGVSYCFNPFFFKLGVLFKQPTSTLVRIYQAIDIGSSLICFIAAASVDRLRTGVGFWFSGARNLIMLFMLLQCSLFFALTFMTSNGWFGGFVVMKALLKVFMVCHEIFASLLARDFFGSANLGFVFGIGAGLAIGSGEACSAWLLSAVEVIMKWRKGSTIDSALGASDYNGFFIVAACWSFLGLVSVVALRVPTPVFCDDQSHNCVSGSLLKNFNEVQREQIRDRN